MINNASFNCLPSNVKICIKDTVTKNFIFTENEKINFTCSDTYYIESNKIIDQFTNLYVDSYSINTYKYSDKDKNYIQTTIIESNSVYPGNKIEYNYYNTNIIHIINDEIINRTKTNDKVTNSYKTTTINKTNYIYPKIINRTVYNNYEKN